MSRLFGAYGRLHMSWIGLIYGKVVRRHLGLANLTGLNGGWAYNGTKDGLVLLRKGSRELELTKYHAGVMLSEIMVWPFVYLPGFSLEGKTVLDVGAGCGETAAFWFEHGASRVVAIESDPKACALLKKNAQRNRWQVEVVEGPFRLEHLSISHDFLKIDIEGGEKLLLDYDGELKPCCIEIHSSGKTRDAIVEKFGLKATYSAGNEMYGAE